MNSSMQKRLATANGKKAIALASEVFVANGRTEKAATWWVAYVVECFGMRAAVNAGVEDWQRFAAIDKKKNG